MKSILTPLFAACLAGLGTLSASGQKTSGIAFGSFNQWVVREVKESGVIGGEVRYIYEIGPTDTLRGDQPYHRNPHSPWGTSNVLAKVSGITKCSVTVFPEARGNGRCARLDTRLETVKVMGMINITVLASGSIFLGDVIEPIKDTKNPMAKLNQGIPFTERPKALVMDYKFHTDGSPNRIKATGFSAQHSVPGKDHADAILLLQVRWEDAEGNVYAKRVGTLNEQFGQNTPAWVNGHTMPILYGDITHNPKFRPEMGLMSGDRAHWCRNSKGRMVPIQETGWAAPDEKPTHMILQISSSYGGAYVGTPGNSLWVDNIKLAY
ncbi:PCMD domain-containing protein [uncultured Rikenella sp.]|uniref:PCMD domain-containing protein n=1 Tax=uncultured Rikenella sp. TaxID=368003 RepID=UPI00272D9006|nr:PCMD domain-containing protein [uncultured Rikenella sp.]